MIFSANYATNIGHKAVNQDSIFVHTIGEKNEIGAFMVLCDGMGGLSHGEYASASVLQAFSGWFYDMLPQMQQSNFQIDTLKEQWTCILKKQHQALYQYGMENHERIGTTICAILLYGNEYYTLNVGDSRIYEIYPGHAHQLTKDHSWVQSAVDQGLMTPEQARVDKRRNRLLQCVGSGRIPVADFSCGRIYPEAVYLVCCDGFYHELSEKELIELFATGKKINTAEKLRKKLEYSIQIVLKRGEKDNITAGAVYTNHAVLSGCLKNLLDIE